MYVLRSDKIEQIEQIEQPWEDGGGAIVSFVEMHGTRQNRTSPPTIRQQLRPRPVRPVRAETREWGVGVVWGFRRCVGRGAGGSHVTAHLLERQHDEGDAEGHCLSRTCEGNPDHVAP